MSDKAARLRKGIQDYLDGNYPNPRDARARGPQEKCPHGQFYWESCENCIEAHFMKLLAEIDLMVNEAGTGQKIDAWLTPSDSWSVLEALCAKAGG